MVIAYIGVGSNLGDRQGNIDLARTQLQKKRLSVLRTSPFYENEALCKQDQKMPPFLNGVFEVETQLSPEDLLNLLEVVERALGRSHKGNWQPRTIDLDLLLYEDTILDTPRLKLPHPEMAKRWFVLKPLADLVPELRHPVLGKTIQELLKGGGGPWNFSLILPIRKKSKKSGRWG